MSDCINIDINSEDSGLDNRKLDKPKWFQVDGLSSWPPILIKVDNNKPDERG